MRFLILAAAVALGAPLAASAGTPEFRNGDRTAAQVERLLNGKPYRARLKTVGASLSGPVSCAYDGILLVECSGTIRMRGKRISATWTLEKRSASRAKLSWEFEGSGVYQASSSIVRPRDIGATAF